MKHESLYVKIRHDVIEWRKKNYPSEFEEIAQVLGYQFVNEERSQLLYLRKPQFEALETYLFLRFVKNTAHIIDLYTEYFSQSELLRQFVDSDMVPPEILDIVMDGGGLQSLFEKIQSDNDFVRRYKLANVRESITLPYSSYIFSLVMGAGKTILIGSIIFIEFALSLKTKSDVFLKNALVFAPGKTIIGSLKEIAQIRLNAILPPSLADLVNINVKMTYTQDNQKDIPIIRGSHYNIIVTNIEKIRILSKRVATSPLGELNFQAWIRAEERQNTVNLRLQTISTLKSLGVFSDEAHNTYGQDLDKGIKKVRQTINYLANKTELRLVINTTGTPYFKRQVLRDVVFWYGLLEGIEENILKDIRGNNIYSYSEVKGEEFIRQVLDDFFTHYKDLAIEGGYEAKIAIYFPTIESVREIRPFIERHIIQYGLNAGSIFEVNSQSSKQDKDTFINRINDKNLPYRIFLLVQMGTEGWNCPSLFSCCLARDLGNSKNFVLQASMRCLRQLPGNSTPARIYLSHANTAILNKQLQENFGENLTSIQSAENKFIEKKITLIRYDLPAVKTIRKVRKYRRKDSDIRYIAIQKPEPRTESAQLIKYDFDHLQRGSSGKGSVKLTEKEYSELRIQAQQEIPLCLAALKISSLYALNYFTIFRKLHKHFPAGLLAESELTDIQAQIEAQLDNYSLEEIETEEWLTIIKKEGFREELRENGTRVYTTNIFVNREKLDALVQYKQEVDSAIGEVSFHYNPYKFDSALERNLFEFALSAIHDRPENIAHFLFVGGITDRSKTDLIFEYRDATGKLRSYTPDFLLIKKNGAVIFLETKGKHLEQNFAIKQREFKNYLPQNYEFHMCVSEHANIYQTDKQWLRENL